MGRRPKWRAAEEYGFDHAWTYDHLGWRSLVEGSWFNAVPTLAAAAMVTSTIGLGTFVVAEFPAPVPFAREAITLDDLSDGRLILGVGAGDSATTPGVGCSGAVGRATCRTVRQFVEALDGLLRTDGFDYSRTTRRWERGTYPAACGGRDRRCSSPPTDRG